MQAKVTAFVLSFNRSAFLAEALESIGAQTEKTWTLLLSDCSSDHQAAKEIETIFETFKRRHPNRECRMLKQDAPMRQHRHMEAAMQQVHTPYIALLDDDDYWLPDHLERSLAWLESDAKHGLAIDNARVVDEQGRFEGVLHSHAVRLPPPECQAAEMEFFLRTFYGSTSGFVLRRGAYDGWPLPSLPLIDVHIAFAVAANGLRCRCFRETGYAYRVHGGSHYEKGNQVFRERHIWRCRLGRKHAFKITRHCPRFPLFFLKSLCFLLADRLGSRKQGQN
jgi:glycosyltransferase involved in cell wall biosynthesis